MSSYISQYVEYASILRALETVSRSAWERWGKQNSSTGAWAVADYKTIGFTVGRQCGATRGIHQWVSEHRGKCLVISKDRKMRDSGLENYLTQFPNSDMTDYYRASARMLNEVTFSYEHDDDDETLHNDMIENVRYVILDDSAHQYVLGRPGGRVRFNEWVAETFHDDTFVILVK
jgi:hypothetical protein